MMIRIFLIFTLFLCSCYRVADRIDPRLSSGTEQQHIAKLPSPFSKLNNEEKKEPWGQEYSIALSFAQEFDLYRAVSTFKRARALMDHTNPRIYEIDYFTILCYYLGKQYEDVILTFEKSDLPFVDQSFQTYRELLVLLYESYMEIGEEEKIQKIFDLTHEYDQKISQNLALSTALLTGQITPAKEIAYQIHGTSLEPFSNTSIIKTSFQPQTRAQQTHFSIEELLDRFEAQKKNVALAQVLNILPGAGYLYLGMKKTALSAFLVNSVFIASAAYFFQKGNIPAGMIATSFEMGWFFGGIYGAGESAKFYNEQLYEKMVSPVMNDKKLFPTLMLQYGF